MSKEQLRKYMPEIKEVHSALSSVKHFGDLPKGKRHLYSRYASQDLIKTRYKTTPTGARIPDKLMLTKKGKNLFESVRL